MTAESKNEHKIAMLLSALFGGLGLLAVLILTLRVQDESDTIMLMFPLNYGLKETMAAIQELDGKVVRFGATENLVVAKFGNSNISKIIHGTGALTAINPIAAEGCVSTPENFMQGFEL